MNQIQALQKASEIRSRVKDTVYVLDQGIEVRLKASFGIATFPQHATDSNSLIAAADQALFAIKEAGKDAIGQFKNFSGFGFVEKGEERRLVVNAQLVPIPGGMPHEDGRPEYSDC